MALCCAAAFWAPALALGEASQASLLAASRPVASVFFIAKSENKNQVHYGVRVDAHCRLTGTEPVYGYWRDFEDGPNATSKLLGQEQPAYGVTRPRKIENSAQGGKVLFGLRGFPDRSITIQTFSSAGECKAWAMTEIKKQPAILRSLYVELGFLFSIDFVLLRGVRIGNGEPVQEKVDD